MQVTINGVAQEIEPGATVRDIVATHTGRTIDQSGMPEDGRPLAVAVAVGGQVLRRADWAATCLGEADTVDVVTAVQGG